VEALAVDVPVNTVDAPASVEASMEVEVPDVIDLSMESLKKSLRKSLMKSLRKSPFTSLKKSKNLFNDINLSNPMRQRMFNCLTCWCLECLDVKRTLRSDLTWLGGRMMHMWST
jgi:hypothetical protein